MKVILLVREYRAVLWGWRKWRTYQEWNATARVNHRPKYIVGHLFPTNGPPCITLSFWCVLSLQLAIKIVITGLYKHFCKHFFFLSDMLFLMFITLFLVCCTGFFSSCGKRGLLSSCGARASHWRWLLLLQSRGSRALRLQKLRLRSSRTQAVVVVHELTCSEACGILPDQESPLCLLH